MNIIKNLLILVMIVFCLCIISGCSKYEKITLNLNGTSISFQYPKSYQYTYDTRITNGQVEQGLGLGVPVNYYEDIIVYDPELTITFIETYEDAKSYLDNFVKSLQNSSVSPEGNKMSILERSSISVAGIGAEQVMLSVKSVLDQPLNPISPSIIKRVYLNHNTKIWVIDIESSENMSVQMKADFDHIIKTFKFLD